MSSAVSPGWTASRRAGMAAEASCTHQPPSVNPGQVARSPRREVRSVPPGNTIASSPAAMARAAFASFTERSVAGSSAIIAATARASSTPNAARQRAWSQPGASRSGSASSGGSRSRPRNTALTRPLNIARPLSRATRSTEVATAAWAGVFSRNAWATPSRRICTTLSGGAFFTLACSAASMGPRWRRVAITRARAKARSRAESAASAGWLRPSSMPARPPRAAVSRSSAAARAGRPATSVGASGGAMSVIDAACPFGRGGASAMPRFNPARPGPRLRR